MPLFAFRLVPFTAGQDDKGKDIVLCDVEEVGLEGALASTRQRFGELQNNNTPKPGGKLQKIMVKALAQLARKHPEGVEKALLKSAFICDYVAAEHAAGRPTPDKDTLTRKFRQTLADMVRTGRVEDLGDGLLLPGGDES